MEIVFGLFFIILAAVFGGALSKTLKLPSLVGYIIAGIVFGTILPASIKNVSTLAQLGTILLLFSIGVELSLDKLTKFIKVAFFGSSIQIILVTTIGYFILHALGLSSLASLILSLGFSISSTAVLVIILGDRGEMDTIHGNVMFSWSLMQDLAVIPIMVVLPILGSFAGGVFGLVLFSLVKALLVVAAAIILGKLVVPYIIHFVSAMNSRELLLLTSVALALGTAGITSFFGISPALGAFLAGVVISGSQEHHAIFAETRPLRDLFMALFFVTLGFLVTPEILISKFFLIILVALLVIILKALVVFFVSAAFGYKGRTGIAAALGLAQVGEFAFVIFSSALSLKLLSPADTTLGISVTLVTLIVSPILFKFVVPLWRALRDLTGRNHFLYNLFTTGEKRNNPNEVLENHIIICGYGRVGKWIGKAFQEFSIPFIVVDYNQRVVNDLKESGISVLYGDPTEPEVLEAAGIREAKALILAIPDHIAQETLITYTQSVSPNTKIISRVHLDEDWNKLKILRVDKIVQPEFEAAIAIVRSVLINIGKSKEEIQNSIKSLRISHAK